MSAVAEKQLLAVARELRRESLREVVDFAEFLLARSSAAPGKGAAQGGHALRRYIGGVKHGRLAAEIDDELYGRPVR